MVLRGAGGDGITNDLHQIAALEQIACCLPDADVSFDAAEDDGSTPEGVELVEECGCAAGAKGHFFDRCGIMEQCGEVRLGAAEMAGVLFEPETRDVEHASGLKKAHDILDELRALVHEGSEGCLHVNDDKYAL